MRLWPLLLVLAGLVRVGNYLIDRQPRSPVGGLLLTAVGGILFVTQWRGESFSVAWLGRYWFWLLLAYVLGRVLWQYTYRSDDAFKTRPRFLSPGSVFIMLFIVGSGLASNYLARQPQILKSFSTRIDSLGAQVMGEFITVEDEAALSFELKPNTRLLIAQWRGDVQVQATEFKQPQARLIKRIRATNETQAREAATKLHLQLRPAANQLEFHLQSEGVTQEFTTELILTLPAQMVAPMSLDGVSGDVTLRRTRGDHSLRNCGGAMISQQQGALLVESMRGAVQLQDTTGDVRMTAITRDVVIDNLKGALSFNADAGNHRLNGVTGALTLALAKARLDLRNVQAPQPFAADKPLVFIEKARDSRLHLREINGATVINARNSRIETEALTGDLSIESADEAINVLRHKGKLRIRNEDGAVTVSDLTGAADIEAGREVAVQNFSGTLAVKTEYSTITLTQNAALQGDIQVSTERGQVKLNLPSDIGFRLDASTESGHIRVKGFDGIPVERRQTTLTANYHATNATPLITLRNMRGNIELRATGQALASAEK